jgi:hypothetical protein
MLYTAGMKRRIQTLETQIAAIKRELVALGELRPGSLSQQYNVCGSPGCRCKASPPRKHGPYYQLSYTRKGKDGTRFVKQTDVPAIRAAMANYTRLRELIDRWIDKATELSDLKLQLRIAGGRPAKRA